MLTCIGNKRKLCESILHLVEGIKVDLGKDKLNILDAFAGSSVVSRKLSHIADNLYSNDMEQYAYLMAKCYLSTPSESEKVKVYSHITAMNELAREGPFVAGIICDLYAPQDSKNIQEGERCFYTHENALIIDTLRKYIADNVDESLFCYCITPLLNKASIHANTGGVFKGYYKDNTGKGAFGGQGKNCLTRILEPIKLDVPVWNGDASFTFRGFNMDINQLMPELPSDLDVVYLDPPYNQHPYGSNYFMLNVIARNERPKDISTVSGIPTDWKRSNYNYKGKATKSMEDLLKVCTQKSKYVILSYNNEGIISTEDWARIFESYEVVTHEIPYDTYKASRNLSDRNDKVVEIMHVIKRKGEV